MSVNVEDIPLATNKSSRSGTLFSSVGQYVGVPVDRNEYFFTWVTFDNYFNNLLLLNVSPIVCFAVVIASGYKFYS
jgi:hypothetical protein